MNTDQRYSEGEMFRNQPRQHEANGGASRRAFLTVLCAGLAASPAIVAWAESLPKLPHFFKVNDSLYRGAQPSDDDFKTLAKLGVKTVINLRSTDERIEREQKLVEGLGMRYVTIPLHGYETPSNDKIRQAVLEIKAGADKGAPVFVHCKRGRDRTGTVIASYRMTYEGLTNEQALNDAKKHKIGWHQRAMRKYISSFKPSQIGINDSSSQPVGTR